MTKHIEMVGKVFGRLTVKELHAKDAHGRTSWLCLCSCGNSKVATANNLRRSLTKSCGCLQKERASAASVTHGESGTLAYRTWANMISRCTNESNNRYADYGGRGITVCARWFTFENFLSDMGYPPEGKTLDRRDNSKGYSPLNCRWATKQEQANNTSRNSVIELGGVKKTASEWGRELKIPGYLVAQRIRRGWSPERALTPSIKES